MASFVSATPKCCKCDKTAYSQESILYDGTTYHKRCFRCSKCESVVSLGKVAMIQGDLYCKNCYLRMFSEKGSYHVFGAKTLPKSMRKGTDSPRESSASLDETHSAGATSPVVNARSSSVDKVESKEPRLQVTTAKAKTCMVDECQSPRAAGKSYCDLHVEQKAREKDVASKPAVSALLDAIKAKSVNLIKDLLHQHGPGLCLEQHNRKSILQIAFVDESSVACGDAMVETLADYLKDLEADVAMLKDSMPEDKGAASPEAPAAASPPVPDASPAPVEPAAN